MDLSGKVALVDGSNIAWGSDSLEPRTERLHTTRRALQRAGFRHVEIVCDASLRHHFKVRTPEQYAEFEDGLGSQLWSQTPRGRSFDRVILERLKADENAVVVSNDAYLKPEDQPYRPVDLEKRHIRVQFYKDRLQLLFPEAWRDTPTIIEPYEEISPPQSVVPPSPTVAPSSTAPPTRRRGAPPPTSPPSRRPPPSPPPMSPPVPPTKPPPPPEPAVAPRRAPTPRPALYWFVPLVFVAGLIIAAVVIATGGDHHQDQSVLNPLATPRAPSSPVSHTTTRTPTPVTSTSTPARTPALTPQRTPTPVLTPAPTPEAKATPVVTPSPPPPPTTTATFSSTQPTLESTPTPIIAPTGNNVLTSGQVVVTTISEGELPEWVFFGEARQFVEIRTDRDPAGNVFPEIRLLNPNREEVASVEDWQKRGYAQLHYTLKDTGQFLIQIDGRGGSGPFTLRFAVNPWTDISSGELVTGSLDLPEQLDRYRFRGAAGQLVEIRMIRDPRGSAFPKFSLYNPFGDTLFQQEDWQQQGYLVRSETLRDTGDLELVVQAYQWKQTGGYTLELSIDPFIPFAIGRSTTGHITKPVQRDRYQFDGTIGQKIRVRIDRDPTGNLQPAFEVYDPSGNMLGEGEDWQGTGTISGEYTLGYTGKHILVVRGYRQTETGGYTLRLD